MADDAGFPYVLVLSIALGCTCLGCCVFSRPGNRERSAAIQAFYLENDDSANNNNNNSADAAAERLALVRSCLEFRTIAAAAPSTQESVVNPTKKTTPTKTTRGKTISHTGSVKDVRDHKAPNNNNDENCCGSGIVDGKQQKRKTENDRTTAEDGGDTVDNRGNNRDSNNNNRDNNQSTNDNDDNDNATARASVFKNITNSVRSMIADLGKSDSSNHRGSNNNNNNQKDFVDGRDPPTLCHTYETCDEEDPPIGFDPENHVSLEFVLHSNSVRGSIARKSNTGIHNSARRQLQRKRRSSRRIDSILHHSMDSMRRLLQRKSSLPSVEREDCCSICLEPYKVGDRVARMKHYDDGRPCSKIWFKEDCIVEWLQKHDDCPLSRIRMIYPPSEEGDGSAVVTGGAAGSS